MRDKFKMVQNSIDFILEDGLSRDTASPESWHKPSNYSGFRKIQNERYQHLTLTLGHHKTDHIITLS